MSTYTEGDALRYIALKSNDGGVTWVSHDGSNMQYAEGDTERVILLQSNDGGVTWTPVTSPAALPTRWGQFKDNSVPLDGNYVVLMWNADDGAFEPYALGSLITSFITKSTDANGFPVLTLSPGSSLNIGLSSSGAPLNTEGADGEWTLAGDGHIYFKVSGAWVLKV